MKLRKIIFVSIALFFSLKVSSQAVWNAVPGILYTSNPSGVPSADVNVGINNTSPSNNLTIGTANAGSTVTTPTTKISVQEDNPWIELKDQNGTFVSGFGNVGGGVGLKLQAPAETAELSNVFYGAIGTVASFKRTSTGLGYHIQGPSLWIGTVAGSIGGSLITFTETTRFNLPTSFYGATNDFVKMKAGLNNMNVNTNVFDVTGSGTVTGNFNINTRLAVGMTTDPSTKVAIKTEWGDWIQLRRAAGNGYWAIHNPQGENMMSFFYRNDAGVATFDIFNLFNNGAVGINTNAVPAGYKLAVKGKIICEELMVKLASTWPDYVFDKDYQLKSLYEVEQYIEANKHLPDVPSATEIEENGVPTAEMLQIHMKKIEEITLYMIELKKENDMLKQKIEEISNRK